jgi:hypothetical protein
VFLKNNECSTRATGFRGRSLDGSNDRTRGRSSSALLRKGCLYTSTNIIMATVLEFVTERCSVRFITHFLKMRRLRCRWDLESTDICEHKRSKICEELTILEAITQYLMANQSRIEF